MSACLKIHENLQMDIGDLQNNLFSHTFFITTSNGVTNIITAAVKLGPHDQSSKHHLKCLVENSKCP